MGADGCQNGDTRDDRNPRMAHVALEIAHSFLPFPRA